MAAEPGKGSIYGAINVNAPHFSDFGHFYLALKCQKLVNFLRLNGSDGLRLHYFTPKFQKKFSCDLNLFGGVNRQHDRPNDWKRAACGGGSMTVFCNEANGLLMMHQGRACLLL